MDIGKKIDEIRSKPEHIRLHWIWGSVTLSMLAVFAIWIFSITSMFKVENDKSSKANDTVFFDLKNNQTKDTESTASLKEYTGNKSLTTDSENDYPSQKNADAAKSISDVDDTSTASASSPAQSDAYSKLANPSQ